MKNIVYKLFNFLGIPCDCLSKKYPVSVKGVVFYGNKVVLLKNERDEWELPGGKLEENETIQETLKREIKEELSLDVSVNAILDSWVYNILNTTKVVIITYLCTIKENSNESIVLSNEHKAVGLFTIDEIEALNMPQGYKNSIFVADEVYKSREYLQKLDKIYSIKDLNL